MPSTCVRFEITGLSDFNSAHSTQISLGSMETDGSQKLSVYSNDALSVGTYQLSAGLIFSDYNKAAVFWNITIHLTIQSGSGATSTSTSTSSTTTSSSSSTTCTSTTTTTCTSSTTSSTQTT